MYIKNNVFKTVYRLLFLFVCEAGIILQYASIPKASVGMLTCYYTVLSNILCFIYFAYLVVVRPGRENAVIKGAVTMCIALTGIVYHLLLTGIMESNVANVSDALNVGNYIVHTVVPLMVFIDYLFFTPKGTFKSLSPLAWTVIPLAYLAFAIIRAEVGTGLFSGFGGAKSRYPYPFMDFDLLGTGKAVLYIIVIAVAYIALGYFFYLFDRLLGKTKRGK